MRRTVAIILSLLLVISLTGCSSETDTTEVETTTVAVVADAMEGYTYTDGTYTGVSDGYGSDLTVSVVIEDNQITSVEVVSHNEEHEEIYGEAMDTVPGLIVEDQYPIVDAVSGATMTSYGIMNAVIDALSQAMVDGELPDALELPEGHEHGDHEEIDLESMLEVYVTEGVITEEELEALIAFLEENDPKNGGGLEDPIASAAEEGIITEEQAASIELTKGEGHGE